MAGSGPHGGDPKESASRTGMIAGVLDVTIILVAACAAHSTLVVADFLKTTIEFAAVLLAWLAIRKINRGASHEFQYGMGKLENLSSLFVGVAMLLCFVIIFGNAIEHIFHPVHVSGIGVWILFASEAVYAVINGWLFWTSRRVAVSANSPIMASQARLFLSKFFGNMFILVSLSLSLSLAWRGYSWAVYIDPTASMIIGGFILIAAIGVFSNSYYDLLDRTLEESHQILILRELSRHFHEYEALHGIRSRRSGAHVFIEVFLEFAPERPVGEVQEVVNRLRRAIEERIRGSRVTIGLANERVC